MSNIADILSATFHRPFNIPEGQWKYYQEWNDALFLHWKISYDVLRRAVPEKLVIETFEGDCYISLVAFTMERIRPRFLPALSFVSSFHEINVRTYIKNEEKEGVYFINIEAEKHIATFVARLFSGLPYEKSFIKRKHRHYKSINHIKAFKLDVEFEINNGLKERSAFEKGATERYCLYLERREKLFRYDVQHKEWGLKNVELCKLDVAYKIGDIILGDRPPDAVHYSDGVKVLAWKSSCYKTNCPICKQKIIIESLARNRLEQYLELPVLKHLIYGTINFTCRKFEQPGSSRQNKRAGRKSANLYVHYFHTIRLS